MYLNCGNTDKRLLFELYVHKENLKRTLCQGIFANMQEIAKGKLRRRKQRDEGTTGLEKKKAYTLKEWTCQIFEPVFLDSKSFEFPYFRQK